MVMVYMATAVDFYKDSPDGDWDKAYGAENYENRFANQTEVQELI